MDGMQIDMLRITIRSIREKIKYNFIITSISFLLLIAAIILIEIHPKSVWYYFCVGFLLSEMFWLVAERVKFKILLEQTIKKLQSIYKPTCY
jgi:hypothetical protein